MTRDYMRTIACVVPLLALAFACGSPTAEGQEPSPGNMPPRGAITKVDFLQSKDEIANRDCVAVGRVTARGAEVEGDLKDQTKALGGNYVVVNAYTYKRKHLGYAVKGVAYYCY